MGSWKAYRFPVIMLVAIIIGSIAGFIWGEDAMVVQPLGDLFLNMMFTIVVPLVFFSIASAVAVMDSVKRLGRILGSMMIVFIVTGIISSCLMLAAVVVFPPAENVSVSEEQPSQQEEEGSFADQLVETFTVSDFIDIFSTENMLALIVFAMLVGVATGLSGEAGKPFARFLQSGSEVFMKIVALVLYYAPIGLGAYFAALVGEYGPQLIGEYAKAVAVYYPVAILYFIVGFSFYAWVAGGRQGFRSFWKNIFAPAVTSLGTASSVASLPVNLNAARNAGVPKDIRETILPIGATIHMDGSCLSAILKIAFVFGVFQMEFTGLNTYLTAIGIALLSGMVMSGVPGGGFIGEIMIVTLYGLPIEALPIITAIGIVVDPPATTVNVAGDNVSSMLVARYLEGKNWMNVHF